MATENRLCKEHKKWTLHSDEVTGKMECVRCLSQKETAKMFAEAMRKRFEKAKTK